MQQSPNRISSKKSKHQTVAKAHTSAAQHVSNRNHHLNSPALRSSQQGGEVYGVGSFEQLPYETLCHITSYLDPPSLANLSGVNKYLYEFLSGDVVWKLALYVNLLDIHPEREHESSKAFLLRRLESTWKGEYITRHNILSRWKESRTTYTAHNPLLIPVPNIHMLADEESLLIAPEHFSWILRSIPSRGKILKGHFQPTLLNQAHPANDWSPPSAGAIGSDRHLAKMVWGSQAGHVMVKTAQKAMDPKANRDLSVVASAVGDPVHEGFINHVSWAKHRSAASSLEYFVTAGEDGCVKLWAAETCFAIWTSPHAEDGAPFVRAEFDLSTRTVVALAESGHVFAWSPIPMPSSAIPSTIVQPVTPVKQVVARLPSDDARLRVYPATSTLLLENSGVMVSAIIHVKGDIPAWRFTANFEANNMEVLRFDGPLAAITAMYLHSPTKASEKPVLMAGDTLSQVSIYDLSTNKSRYIQNTQDNSLVTQTPNLTFTAHDYGAIAAIAASSVVIVTGNEMGIINVWDAVTLAAVRLIDCTKLAKREIGVLKLIVGSEQVLASIGRSVMHWKTGLIPAKIKRAPQKVKAGKIKTRMEEYERAIKDSQTELEIMTRLPRPSIFTEQDQMIALQSLGLDEAGAVEYALMLSHQEALQAELASDLSQIPNFVDPALEESEQYPDSQSAVDDWDEERPTSESPTTRSLSPSVRSQSSSVKGVREDFMPSSPWKSSSMTKFSPPKSVGKIQISPPYQAEAMQVGPPSSASSERSVKVTSESEGEKSPVGKGKEAFPLLSSPSRAKAPRPPSPRSIHSKATIGTSKGATHSTVKPGVPKGNNAKPSTPGPSWSNIVKTSAPTIGSKKGPWPGLPSAKTVRTERTLSIVPRDVEDRELQFVLELSRAEALSRGDVEASRPPE